MITKKSSEKKILPREAEGGKNEVLVLENLRKRSLDSSVLIQRHTTNDDVAQRNEYLRGILQNLTEMTSSMRKEQDDSDIQIEWVRLSQFIDKLSFWAFLFLAVMSIALLFIGYSIGEQDESAVES